jgi:hypothetical protein
MRVIIKSVSTSLTLLALAAMPLAAAEMTVADLRLGVGILSNEFKGASSTTVTNQNNNTVTSTNSSENGRNSDDNWRGQLQFISGSLGAGGGLLWGVGVAVNNASWDNGTQDAHVSTPVIDVMLGYGYAFTPKWHFEVMPFAGYGRAYYSVTDNGSSSTSKEWGHYMEYGAKIGTYVSLNESLVLGVEVPYLVGRFDPDYSYKNSGNDSVTVSDTRRNQGFGVLLTLGGRF